MSKARLGTFLKAFGPGLIFAATAVGVSHLVQSTRAGATFGFALVWAVVAANVFKYPAFEAGPRYAVATGKSLVHGYRALGVWALVLFLVMTIGTMFTVQAVVTIVTGALLTGVTGPDTIGVDGWSAIITGVCIALLFVGRFPLLDKLVKVLIVLLTVTTVIVLVAAIGKGSANTLPVVDIDLSPVSIAFLIGLMGWMPSAIDIAVWHSIWTLERKKQTKHEPTLKQVNLDFNIGYIGTSLLALMFLTLGAIVMFDPQKGLLDVPDGAGFANALIGAYTSQIGDWSRPFILTAAIATMFSTTLTVIDSFPRVMKSTVREIAPRLAGKGDGQPVYWVAMAVISAVSVAIIALTVNGTFGGFTDLITLATGLSFASAPVLAWLNYRVVTAKSMPEHARPKRAGRAFHLAGLAFLAAFALIYIAQVVPTYFGEQPLLQLADR